MVAWRPLVPLRPSLPEAAELVAFWVGQYDPGSILLADAHPPCAMSDQPSHLGVLVIRPGGSTFAKESDRDTRDGGTGWGVPGVVRFELRI